MKRVFHKAIRGTVFSIFVMFLVIPVHPTPNSQKFVKVYFPNGDSVTAELAVTLAERARGLMFRKKLDFDQGMLFIFDEEDIQSFWMKNMIIPLDILWLDEEKRIVHIEHCVPPCQEKPCPSYASKVPAMYVLELKAGSVEQRKLKPFDRLDFILPDLEYSAERISKNSYGLAKLTIFSSSRAAFSEATLSPRRLLILSK